MQLATENKIAGLFIVVIWCFIKCFTLLFRWCEVVLIPTNPYARRQPDTQIASRLEKERERETVEASCFVQRGPPCCDNNDSKQHAAFTKRAAKTQPSLTTFQVQREDDSVSEPCSVRSEHQVILFCSRSESRQSWRVSIAIAFSDEASVSDVNTENYTWE